MMQVSYVPLSDKIKAVVEKKIQTEYSQSEDFHAINFFYLFLTRTYILLNADDSGFLKEFAFLWDETFPRKN